MLWPVVIQSEGNKQHQGARSPLLLPNPRHGKWDETKYICMFPSSPYVPSTLHTCTNTQARPLGGPSELGGVGYAPTAGCGSAVTWLVIGPDPETAEVGRIQMNPQGCWPVNLTWDQCLWDWNRTTQGHSGWAYWPWTVTSLKGREKGFWAECLQDWLVVTVNYKIRVTGMM